MEGPADRSSLPAALVRRLGEVRSVGAITGAGVSKESGIPTYRGRGGLYDDPAEGDRTVEALSGSTLVADPDRTWRAVAALARRAGEARPNAAHRALSAIERHVSRFVLLTQNVDRLHRIAGSRNVIDIHGDVFRTVCLSCDARGELEPETLTHMDAAPHCTVCAGTLRPDAVLFGELLPPEKVERLREEFYGNPPDLILVVGTSALFPYITEPVRFARASGRLTVEVDPAATPLSGDVDFALRGPASVYVPLIERALRRDDPTGFRPTTSTIGGR